MLIYSCQDNNRAIVNSVLDEYYPQEFANINDLLKSNINQFKISIPEMDTLEWSSNMYARYDSGRVKLAPQMLCELNVKGITAYLPKQYSKFNSEGFDTIQISELDFSMLDMNRYKDTSEVDIITVDKITIEYGLGWLWTIMAPRDNELFFPQIDSLRQYVDSLFVYGKNDGDNFSALFLRDKFVYIMNPGRLYVGFSYEDVDSTFVLTVKFGRLSVDGYEYRIKYFSTLIAGKYVPYMVFFDQYSFDRHIIPMVTFYIDYEKDED
ncbi:MAG: hypothetical protein HOF96_12425 [Candidatus Marinimicrobia bacterium]|nr:hypothetical protein [Candidatus Neomarinimicrobiota bacterium]MBT7200124.1 hypothetical protein [Candidatus Neomarinimicrobiota bacterium]